MKNTLKKRTFISAIAMLVVSAIVLTSSTFAWFSMAKEVQVESMNLNITSPDGVQLSGNANAFTTMLTLADLKGETTARWAAYDGNQNNFPELISPSSSNMGAVGALPSFFSGSIDDSGYLNASYVSSEMGSGFVAFDIFVKVGKAQKVYWDQTKITCTDNPDVISAMRVALVNCGVVPAKAEAADILSVLPENQYNNRVVMFEPNSQNHTDASGYADGVTAPDKYIRAAFSKQTPGGNGNNITTHVTYTSDSLCTRATDVDPSNAYFNAAVGINRVRVYLWMEGNDVDCANDVAGSSINFNLVLTIV